MKLRVNAKDLLKTLNLAKIAVGGQRGEAIYKSILFLFENNQLKLITYDCEVFLYQSLPCLPIQTDQSAMTLINLKITSSLLKSFENVKSIEITLTKEKAHFSSAEHPDLEIQASNGDERGFLTAFKTMKIAIDKFNHSIIPRRNFLTALQRICHSLCKDETRQKLLMVHMENNHIMASDGSRLSYQPFRFVSSCPISINSKKIEKLKTFLKSEISASVKIKSTHEFCLVYGEKNVFMIKNLSHERFPNIQQQLQKAKQNTLSIRLSAEFPERVPANFLNGYH
ncbi:MAG: hypothetical protein AABY86_06945, partial [Bdellovibrionota bacterium]